ncbi:hypothetical protein [Chryseobacterium paridis]|uniref:Natural product n=1 Tax=Chryseobacterium paridis TaxID=2800328 RepID=A0ABS1FSH5_9FLAO|nr:hypothetical protein [Chryseobacterium paridis]MBK1895377.1 hypothetical protein [Chryseobacterium paridis]
MKNQKFAMKKINLKNAENAFSRRELKTIMAGSGGVGGMCDSWRTKPADVCYNCCITVYDKSRCASECPSFNH